MGLACSNIRLLTLTSRKADCENGISINSFRKMALTREQSKLSKEYQSRLQSKNITYIDNGKYNKINYNYLMGYDNYLAITSGNQPLKDDNSMILTDFKGQVIMSDKYANAITSVIGNSAVDKNGRGGTFDTKYIPDIIAKLVPGHTADEFRTIINGDNIEHSYVSDKTQTITGKDTEKKEEIKTNENYTNVLKKLVDFYYPIFSAAASNGWSKEYNNEIKMNKDYINDAITTGSFQLAKVNNDGNYEPDTSLNFFITSGLVETNTPADMREEIKAWYDAERERISAKEDMLDIENQDLSTELEAINTEIQSVKSFIDDAISSVFDWGQG